MDTFEFIDDINFDNVVNDIKHLNIENKIINKEFIDIKENNIEEHFDNFIVEECLNCEICNHIVMFYTKTGLIHSEARMSRGYIIDLLKRYNMTLPKHFE
jgi:hypothetical protein